MTQQEIVDSWLSIRSNRDKLPTIAYPKEVYDFIYSTCTIYTFQDNQTIVCFNWQYFKMIIKN